MGDVKGDVQLRRQWMRRRVVAVGRGCDKRGGGGGGWGSNAEAEMVCGVSSNVLCWAKLGSKIWEVVRKSLGTC